MKKAMQLLTTAIGCALCVMTSAEAANSITYTVGKWRVTMTDLGVLPTGTASSAFAINNRSEICRSGPTSLAPTTIGNSCYLFGMRTLGRSSAWRKPLALRLPRTATIAVKWSAQTVLAIAEEYTSVITGVLLA